MENLLDPKICTYYAAYRDMDGTGPVIKLREIYQKFERVNLAFFVLVENSQITTDFLEKYLPEKELKEDVKWLQENYGTKVLASVIDSPSWGWDQCNEQVFVNNLVQLVDDWGLDGVDWDGDGMEYQDRWTTLIPLAREKLGEKAFFSLVLYQWDSDLDLLKAVKNQVDAVMTMMYGDDYDSNVGLLECYAKVMPKEKLFAGVKVEFGAGAGTSLETVQKLGEYVKKNGYGGMMIWSAEVDLQVATGKADWSWVKTAEQAMSGGGDEKGFWSSWWWGNI